ncbi:MAG: transposase [Gammaproteobacteria bacterium]|nr:transposase [Gammaproteobacteria bacterium]
MNIFINFCPEKSCQITLSSPPDQPTVIFDYDPSRGHEVPLRLLDGYNGYLPS